MTDIKTRAAQLAITALLTFVMIMSGYMANRGAIAQPGVAPIVNDDLQNSFFEALRAAEDIRERDRSTVVNCTNLFASFKRYSTTSPYIAFFVAMDTPIITDDRNNRHYIAVRFKYEQLKSMGFSRFMPGDRLVLVFTTSSAASIEITLFEATILNTDHL